MDAVYLDQWVTQAIQKYAIASAQKALCEQVTDIVPLLDKAMHEIVRHTMYFCEERGTVLENVWGAYVDLFNHVLEEMRTSLRQSEERGVASEEALAFESAECDAIHAEHPEELQVLISSLEMEFAQHSEELRKQVAAKELASKKVAQETAETNARIKSWFPYCSNMMREAPQFGDDGDSDTTIFSKDATTLLIGDLKRIILALRPKQRLHLRALLKDVFELEPIEVLAGANAEKIAELFAEITEQESLIHKLQQAKRSRWRKNAAWKSSSSWKTSQEWGVGEEK